MLDFSADTNEIDLRGAIVECGRIAYERHLMTSNDGNISVRMSDGFIWSASNTSQKSITMQKRLARSSASRLKRKSD